MNPMVSPIIRSALVKLNGNQASGSVDRDSVRNTDTRPWRVDEIRFVDQTPTAVDALGNYSDAYGAFIDARIKIAGQDVTQSYVPLWSLSPYENPIWLRNVSTYVYRPPKPIIVMPGEIPDIDLQVDANAIALVGQAISKNIRVAVCGRPMLPDEPLDQIDVPWCAAWNPLFTSAGGFQESNQNDLVNPFDKPLHVSSLVGNMFFGGNGSIGADAAIAQPDLTELLLTIQMNDTQGGMLIRDPVPFGHVFSAIDRIWKSRLTLTPQAYLIMSANMEAWTPGVDVGNSAYVNVGMHGFRTVDRSEYHG